MIRSVLPLRSAPSRGAALEKFYADHRVLERARAFAGCRDAVLLRPTDGDLAGYLVIADWETASDYQRWVDDPWRAALSGQLADLLDPGDDSIVGRLFEFV